MRQYDVIWPDHTVSTSLELTTQVGRKALGLMCIPRPWCPPFFVLPSMVFQAWRAARASSRADVLVEASAKMLTSTARFHSDWQTGLILRSSAIDETLRDRGAYKSKQLPADFDATTIKKALAEIFTHFQRSNSSSKSAVAIVVQPLVRGPGRFTGHMSNERRVSKTTNQWMYEIQAGFSGRFNSQRADAANTNYGLKTAHPRLLLPMFRAVGRWCTQLKRGPAHIEWAWSDGTLWLLQLDFEDESPDQGIDPTSLIRPADMEVVAPGDVSPLSEIKSNSSRTGWNKIDKIKDMAGVRSAPYPKLYKLRGDHLKVDVQSRSRLAESLRRISNGRVVCRTDCKAKRFEGLNLPRTHSVSPSKAIEFMDETLRNLKLRGVRDKDICFILHRFISGNCFCLGTG